jgi:hypothetical protein
VVEDKQRERPLSGRHFNHDFNSDRLAAFLQRRMEERPSRIARSRDLRIRWNRDVVDRQISRRCGHRFLQRHAGKHAIAPTPEIEDRVYGIPVRTLDALHLASIEFLRARGQTVELASFDERLLVAAHALAIPLYER